MTNKERIEKLVSALQTLKKDAEMALDNKWDRTDSGFESQITLIDNVIAEVEK